MWIFLGIWLVNVATFVAWRIYLALTNGLAADFCGLDYDSRNKTLSYFIAGNLNQADAAFKFMEPEIGENCVFVQFSPKGWSAKATAKKIAHDLQWYHCRHARIFTISLGDHVARYLEKELGGIVEVYAVNPCPNRETLQKTWRKILCWAAPLAEIAVHGLGWLSILPIIPSFGGKYSLALLIDQYWCIYYDHPPLGTSHTCGVICSTNDTFLDNSALEKTYLDAEIQYIDTGHSDIVNNSALYYRAICKLIRTAAP